MADKVRIDKWLWAVRIYKTRTLATDACKEGKIKAGNSTAKPSHLVSVGDRLTVKKNGFNFEFRVLSLLEKRVGAPIAMTCYQDLTPEEEMNKYKEWFIGKSNGEFRDKGAGRPTKRERREIEQFKEDRYGE